MIELTEAQFDGELKAGRKPAICLFWAPYSRPSKQMSTMLSNLEKRFAGAADFFSVNLEEHPGVCDKAGIIVIPTVIIYKSGRASERFFGLIPEDEVAHSLEAIILE